MEQCWEGVWPPEVSDDAQLIEKCVDIIKENECLHTEAWNLMNEKTLHSIHPNLSFIEELYLKSGKMVKPFIDEAYSRLFQLPVVSFSDLEAVLLDESCDPDEDIAYALYRGCVWELTAIFACCIIYMRTNRTGELPASCFDPINRSQFLRNS
jgi:hypothetical protein